MHPFEEVVEERDGERRVPVCRAVDDALGDERCTAWRDRLDTHAQRCRDVAGAVWPRPERRLRCELLPFWRREPVQPHQEEVLVKLVLNSWRRTLDVISG